MMLVMSTVGWECLMNTGKPLISMRITRYTEEGGVVGVFFYVY